MNAFLRKNITRLFTNDASHRRVCCSVALRLFATKNEVESVASPAMFDLLRHKHHFSPQVATKVATVLIRVKDPEISDSILSFLKESGFSNAQLEKMVKYRPKVLLSSLEDVIKPKIRVLQESGFDSNDIAEITSNNPSILHAKVDKVVVSLRIVKSLLGTNENDAVVKLWSEPGCKWLSHASLKEKVVPNFEFLKRYGLPTERIRSLLYKYPRCLILKPEYIRRSVEKAEKMGANRNNNMFIYALRAVSALTDEAWEVKLQAFRSFGFSESDIVKMFKTGPMVFVGSVERLKRTKDVILATGKYGIPSIVNSPIALNCSIEKRLKPRFRILKILESKNLIEENWPSLSTVCKMKNEKFFEEFVGPYSSEVGEVYNIAKSFASPDRSTKQ